MGKMSGRPSTRTASRPTDTVRSIAQHSWCSRFWTGDEDSSVEARSAFMAPSLRLPGARLVVLEEHSVLVLAVLTHHDGIVDAGGAVHQVEGRVEALLHKPDLGEVRAFVGDP